MRRCPACGAHAVPFSARVAAAARSTSRCGACGSALTLTWIGEMLAALAIVPAFLVGFTAASVWLGVATGILVWIASLALPLAVDESDPISFNQRLRQSRKT